MPEPQDDRATIVINGKTYEFPDSYTLGEARMLKKFTGLYLSEINTLRVDDPDWITFTVWCMLHREDASVTVEAVETLDLTPVINQIVEIINKPAEADARPPGDEEPGEQNDSSAGLSTEPVDESETSSEPSRETLPTISGESG